MFGILINKAELISEQTCLGIAMSTVNRWSHYRQSKLAVDREIHMVLFLLFGKKMSKSSPELQQDRWYDCLFKLVQDLLSYANYSEHNCPSLPFPSLAEKSMNCLGVSFLSYFMGKGGERFCEGNCSSWRLGSNFHTFFQVFLSLTIISHFQVKDYKTEIVVEQ